MDLMKFFFFRITPNEISAKRKHKKNDKNDTTGTKHGANIRQLILLKYQDNLKAHSFIFSELMSIIAK